MKKTRKNPESVYRADKRKRIYIGFVGFSICLGCGSLLMSIFFLSHIFVGVCAYIHTNIFIKSYERRGENRLWKKS